MCIIKSLKLFTGTTTQHYATVWSIYLVPGHKLGKVDNECTSHNSVILAIHVPKIRLDKMPTKRSLDIFWDHPVYICKHLTESVDVMKLLWKTQSKVRCVVFFVVRNPDSKVVFAASGSCEMQVDLVISLLNTSVAFALWMMLHSPYLTSGVDRLLHLLSAEAISVRPNARHRM